MITWITGNSGAGKSSLAYMKKRMGMYDIILDGDEMRKVWDDLNFTYQDRWTQNIRIARLAKIFENQGLRVLVATICPYRYLRCEVQRITNCDFIYLNKRGKSPSEQYPYEEEP